jgi:hypothetical protein
MIRNWLSGFMAAVSFFFATSSIAKASEITQSILAHEPLFAQIKTTQTGGKNYVVEGLVVVVLFGAALFVVCKSSRRS